MLGTIFLLDVINLLFVNSISKKMKEKATIDREMGANEEQM